MIQDPVKQSDIRIELLTIAPILEILIPLIHESWGRPGFDVGHEAVQGMPRSSYLVNPLETINANDERYALAA